MAMDCACKLLSEIPPDTESQLEVQYRVKAIELQGLIVRAVGEEKMASHLLNEAVALAKTRHFSDPLHEATSQMQISTLLVNAGRLKEALACADNVNINDFDESDNAANALMHLADVYFRELEKGIFTHSERAKTILLKAKTIYEKLGKQQVSGLIRTYKYLISLISEVERDTSTALKLCEDAWQAAAASDPLLENFSPDDICRICTFAADNLKGEASFDWVLRSNPLLCKIIDRGSVSQYIAEHFAVYHASVFLASLKFLSECTLKRAEACLDVLEKSKDIDLHKLTIARWIVGCLLADEVKDSQKALRLLRSAIRGLKSLGMVNHAFFAFAKGLLAMAHSDQGQYALAAAEFEDSERIITAGYGVGNYLSEIYADEREFAIKRLDELANL
jgi:tetratricopeptide (TPR) repeat protein